MKKTLSIILSLILAIGVIVGIGVSAYAEESELFREIVSTRKICIGVGDSRRLLVNHNKMLKRYDGATGVKTGYTDKSGRCLVSSAERNGITMIAVTLNAPNDWQEDRKSVV